MRIEAARSAALHRQRDLVVGPVQHDAITVALGRPERHIMHIVQQESLLSEANLAFGQMDFDASVLA